MLTVNQLVQQDWSGGDPNLSEWDSEDRLVKVVHKKGAGAVQKTVEYAYCPACGGNRTHKIVKSSTGAITLWLEYETEGLNQLRVDERWDSNGSGTITEADQWRTQRVSFNGPGQIQQLLKETIYNYPSSTTNTVSSQTTIYYDYDRMGVVAGLSNGSGAELQQFESDAFGSWDGLNTYTTRRITGKEYDEDTGLYFFHARWYQNGVGRFTSFDPMAWKLALFRSGAKCFSYTPKSLLAPHLLDSYGIAAACPTRSVDPLRRKVG